MPTARDSVDVTIEFEVCCAECGEGLCGETKYRRGTNNLFDVSCPNCNKKHEEEIKKLEEENAELQRQLDVADDQIRELKESTKEQ